MPIEQDYIISGKDYLEQHPDFKLEGRDEEFKRLSGALMRDRANSVLLVGPGGVGCTAMCLGLEASKNDPDTPFDIINKRFFWLDTDGLFSSGDSQVINEGYKRLSGILARTPEAVLIIDDFKDFIDAARSNGCSNLINSVMRDVKANKFQTILESRDTDIGTVLKCHSDVQEYFTMQEIGEPKDENLSVIIKNSIERLEKAHGIKVSEGAVEAALDVTNKYRVRDMGLSRAQPERSQTLIDRALTAYRLDAHANPPALAALNEALATVNGALANGAEKTSMADKSPEELEAMKISLEDDIKEVTKDWAEQRKKIKKLYKGQIEGEEAINRVYSEIEAQQEEEKERRVQEKESGVPENVPEASAVDVQSFLGKSSAGGFASKKVTELKNTLAQYEKLVAENKREYDTMMAELNSSLLLTKNHVLTEFSALSGIPVTTLGEDQRMKLLQLGDRLKEDVLNQDHAVDKLAKSVMKAGAGLDDSNKPQGAYMYLGPSGVGKTWIAKCLAKQLYGSESALIRFDMSEYMEKHAVAKLIGSPPGYEGYEAGGILTTAVRNCPRSVILFDEIEKAHPDVFDLFLQILDDARLTDNHGLTTSFSDSIIIMTTNVGTRHFLNEDLSFEESEALAIAELEEKYRPEFLNRLNGRRNILCFNRLNLPTIEQIASRELDKINKKIVGRGLRVEIDPVSFSEMCADNYKPIEGARGVVGYFSDSVLDIVGETILTTPHASGIMKGSYDSESKAFKLAAPVSVIPEAANDEAAATKAFRAAVPS